MRVAVDARELCGQPTGVGRYLRSILEAWREVPDAHGHEFVLCSHTALPALDLAPLRVESRVAPGAGGTLWEQTRLPVLVRRAGADVLFAPAYTSPLWSPAPVVLALHDVSFAAHPEWFPWRQRIRRRALAGSAARRAARVLTLTEFSRAEIRDWCGVPARRIAVVSPGVTAWPGAAAPAAPGGGVLFVGSLFERRHVPVLVEAVARLAPRHPDLHLTLVGEDRTRAGLDPAALAARLGVADRVTHHGWVDDQALARLYAGARAFAFLSEYEGFGLTPLEALAAGVPPVVLDTPVAREAYGPAAVYVPRPDPAAVADALARALHDEDTRARVLAAAPAVLARYSWDRCARHVLDALAASARR